MALNENLQGVVNDLKDAKTTIASALSNIDGIDADSGLGTIAEQVDGKISIYDTSNATYPLLSDYIQKNAVVYGKNGPITGTLKTYVEEATNTETFIPLPELKPTYELVKQSDLAHDILNIKTNYNFTEKGIVTPESSKETTSWLGAYLGRTITIPTSASSQYNLQYSGYYDNETNFKLHQNWANSIVQGQTIMGCTGTAPSGYVVTTGFVDASSTGFIIDYSTAGINSIVGIFFRSVGVTFTAGIYIVSGSAFTSNDTGLLAGNGHLANSVSSPYLTNTSNISYINNTSTQTITITSTNSIQKFLASTYDYMIIGEE